MKTQTLVWSCASLVVCSSGFLQAQTAVGTAFTYQGQVKKAGLPLSATADFQFTLWDALAGGNPIGSMVPVDNKTVANGLFTVTLDFGASAFRGDARWLEIAVRSPAGSGTYTTLSPRSELKPAPYTQYALAPWTPSGVGVLSYNGGNVGIGTSTPASRLSVDGTVESTSGGFKFPDGSVQTKAVEGGGGGVPSAFCIMGTSPMPPPGFAYTGSTVLAVNHASWTSGQVMPTPRSSLAAAAVNGKVYAMGGDCNGRTAANEEYDPATNTWNTKAPTPVPLYCAAAAAVNGKLYLIGGRADDVGQLATNNEYDPATNTWTPRAPMPTPRDGLTATAVNGRIYAIGGYTLTTNEEYDPATNTWTSKAPMPTPYWELAAATVNGKIYVIGRVSSSDAVVSNNEYDPATNTWTPRAPMPTPRGGFAAAAINGKIYVIGGVTNWYDRASITGANEEYDPATNIWTTKTPMPTLRVCHAAAAVDDKICAIGGFAGTYPNLNCFTANEAYAPGSDATYYIHRKD